MIGILIEIYDRRVTIYIKVSDICTVSERKVEKFLEDFEFRDSKR